MYRRKLYWLLAIILTAPAIVSKAQDNNEAQQKKNNFQAGIKYLSNNVYLGRKDSVALPYITPSFGYYSKSGFYISTSVSYAPVPEASRIDLVTLEAGYDFSVGKRFDAGFYGGKYFYNTGSFAVNAEINTSVGGYADYDPGPLTLNGGLDLTLGKDADVVANAGLSHSFSAMDEKLEIKPVVAFYAGTQNYFNAYYKSGRHLNIHKKKNTPSNGGGNSQSVTILKASQFKMLEYELSLPVTYDHDKIKFVFTPAYAIPVNPAMILNGSTLSKEGISNSFFAELEFDYRF